MGSVQLPWFAESIEARHVTVITAFGVLPTLQSAENSGQV
jgi:hypothetical protein